MLRYIEQIEPYLQDPVAFPKAQVRLSLLSMHHLLLTAARLIHFALSSAVSVFVVFNC